LSRPLSEFDLYARNYMQQLDHPLRRMVAPNGVNYFIRLKCEQLRRIVREAGLRARDLVVADIGCGIGLFEEELAGEYRRVLALDLSQEMLKVSRHLRPHIDGEHFICSDALRLPLAPASADVVFSSCLFHHMSHEQLLPGVQEMSRICKRGGYVVVFEHNPYNPLTQVVVHTTPLDKNARLLPVKKMMTAFRDAGLEAVSSQFILYGPQKMDVWLTRRAPTLNQLPFGGQYLVVGRKC
jgi:ubiquinone/menaquinone biosynthesis C-methylase UbiE